MSKGVRILCLIIALLFAVGALMTAIFAIL